MTAYYLTYINKTHLIAFYTYIPL